MNKILSLVACTIITGTLTAQSLTNWNYYGSMNPSAIALSNRGGIYHESFYQGFRNYFSFYSHQTAGDVAFKNGKHAIGINSSYAQINIQNQIKHYGNGVNLRYRYQFMLNDSSKLSIGAGVGFGNYVLSYLDSVPYTFKTSGISFGTTWTNDRWKVGVGYGLNFQSQSQMISLFGERKFNFNTNWSLTANLRTSIPLQEKSNSLPPSYFQLGGSALAQYKRLSFGVNYSYNLNIQVGYAFGNNQNWKVGASIGLRSGQVHSTGFISWTLPNKK